MSVSSGTVAPAFMAEIGGPGRRPDVGAAGRRPGALVGDRPRPGAAPGIAPPAAAGGRQAAAPGLLPLGLRRRGRRPRRPAGGRRRAPRSSCCTPSPSSTTTSWTPRRGATAGRPSTPSSPDCTSEAGWRGEHRRFGEGVAILVGDLAFVYSDMLAAGSAPPGVEVFDELRLEVNVGQYLDLLGTARANASARAGPADLPLQVGQVHRSSGPCTSVSRVGRPGAAAPAGAARSAPTGCRSARRSSSATTSSAPSATPT